MRKWSAIIAGLAVFVFERGLDVSGYQNIQTAYGLWIISGCLLVIGISMFAWPYIMKFRHRKSTFPNIIIDLPGKVRAAKMESFYSGAHREGIYYIITDMRFINRSPNPVIIEAKLRVMIGDGHWYLCIAENEPSKDFEKWRDGVNVPIGKHLQLPINLEPNKGISGHLSFFLEREDIEYIFEDEEYEDLRSRELHLEIKEHLTNTEKLVPIQKRKTFISKIDIDKDSTS